MLIKSWTPGTQVRALLINRQGFMKHVWITDFQPILVIPFIKSIDWGSVVNNIGCDINKPALDVVTETLTFRLEKIHPKYGKAVYREV